MAAGADTARLFFAAWPGAEARDALARQARLLQRSCGGRAVPAENLHLTLVFVGEVARERVPALLAAAGSVSASAFDLALDRTGYWRHNRIVWAGAGQTPGSLTALVRGLERGAAAAGFSFDRREYAAHVTLLRGASRSPPHAVMFPVRWPVVRFALVESAPRDGGRRYASVRDWPLDASYNLGAV